MTYRQVRSAMSECTQWMGRLPRSDRKYESDAEKQRAYRERKKDREQIARLYTMATAASMLGDRTARSFLATPGDDIRVRLTETFEQSARARGMTDEEIARLQKVWLSGAKLISLISRAKS